MVAGFTATLNPHGKPLGIYVRGMCVYGGLWTYLFHLSVHAPQEALGPPSVLSQDGG